MPDRAAQMREIYGFEFPAEFFEVWELATSMKPEEPRHALWDSVGYDLTGPYDILAGAFDGFRLRYSPLLHWRYYNDPPEFFTIAKGWGSGQHWGYWLDDPDQGPSCVPHYYNNDAYDFYITGRTQWEAIRSLLETRFSSALEEMSQDAKDRVAHVEVLKRLEGLRTAITRYATADRPEIGDVYTEKYNGDSSRRAATVPTEEGMGIVVPPGAYRPLRRKTWQSRLGIGKRRDVLAGVEEALAAVSEGFPGTALKLGKICGRSATMITTPKSTSYFTPPIRP